MQTQSLDPLSQIFKALSEPIRLRILALLLHADSLCVCDMVTILEQGQSTISRHLNTLKNAGLISSRRQGTWMHYQLIPEAFAPLDLANLKQTLANLSPCKDDLNHANIHAKEPRQCNTTLKTD